MCQAGEEIEPRSHIFWVLVSRSNALGRGEQCVCILRVVFDAPRHGNQQCLLVVISCQFYFTVEVACPILDKFEFYFYVLNEVLCMLLTYIFCVCILRVAFDAPQHGN